MLFRPALGAYIFSMKRRTQIIYPKDLSAMTSTAMLSRGTVLESGIRLRWLPFPCCAMCDKGKLTYFIEKG